MPVMPRQATCSRPGCAGLHYGATLGPDHVTGSNLRGDVGVILRQASPGSIVLAHDGVSEPSVSLIKQLDRVTASMADAGYRFVTVELLAASASGGAGRPPSRSQFRLDDASGQIQVAARERQDLRRLPRPAWIPARR
jgi:hypothetical protein